MQLFKENISVKNNIDFDKIKVSYWGIKFTKKQFIKFYIGTIIFTVIFLILSYIYKNEFLLFPIITNEFWTRIIEKSFIYVCGFSFTHYYFLVCKYFWEGTLFYCLVEGQFFYNRYTQKQLSYIQEQQSYIVHQKEIIEEHQKEIIDSINYAQRIQYALLAHDNLLSKHLRSQIPLPFGEGQGGADYFVLFKPKDIVSGDFYWAVEKDNRFYLAVCDSTGHGVPGAFMCLLNISFLNEAINEKGITAPNEIFNHARKRLTESMQGRQDGMDGILICLSLTLSEGKGNSEGQAHSTSQLPPFRGGQVGLSYAAAHNAPVLIQDGKLIELPYDKMPVGKDDKTKPFALHSINLHKKEHTPDPSEIEGKLGVANTISSPSGGQVGLLHYTSTQTVTLTSLADQKEKSLNTNNYKSYFCPFRISQ